METEGQIKDNLEGTKGQVGDNQGQTKKTSDSTGSQPDLVELPSGEKVTPEELIAGYTKDADYRQKTALLAEDKKRTEEKERRLEAERQAFYEQNAPTREEGTEEENPIERMNARVQNLEVHFLQDYLKTEIQKVSAKYPDADAEAVFDSCWANPRANIEKEMERNQKRVVEARDEVTVEQVLAKDPDAKKKYESKIINDWLAKKNQSKEAGGGVGSGTEGVVTEPDEKVKAKSYNEIGKRVKDKIKEQESAGEMD